MTRHRGNVRTRLAPTAIVLCATILLIIISSGLIIQRQGQATLMAGIEQHSAGEAVHIGSDIEHSLRVIVERAQLLAAEPVMTRILDEDQDHEIDELLAVIVQQAPGIAELSCLNAAGKVIASTNTARLADGGARFPFQNSPGVRYRMTTVAGVDRVTVPIMHQFDEIERIGALEAVIERDALLDGREGWWVGLTSPTGDVLAQRGPSFPAHIVPGAMHYSHPVAGEVTMRHVPVRMPPGGTGPRWNVVVASPNAGLFRPVTLLGKMVGWITAVSAVSVVLLVVFFLRWQRSLLVELASQNERLEAASCELKSQKKELEVRQRELMRINTNLEAAQAEVLLATRAKTEFLANMSHEIRTPMTAILGFTENMLDPTLPDDERRTALHTIRRNGEHLLQVINDILDISKIEAGKLEVECIRCRPTDVVAEVAALMKVRAEAKKLGFRIEWVGAIPETIETDPTRLRQILVNLTGNAIKFTETGGVRLIASLVETASDGEGTAAGPFLQFDVVDTGIGMTPQQVAGLFQPFSQGDASTTRKFGGTGLGLTISKRLAGMLGGGITLDTEPGKGSTFRLTVATGPIGDVRMLDNPGDAAFATSQAFVQTKPDTANFKWRILLAEDGPDNQRLISFILKKAGADVTVVENGRLALDAALEARDCGDAFDVILMDMQMPVMDGYEATRALRRQGYGGTIIALTAHAMSGDREKCLEVGCDDYATKPIDRKALTRIIEANIQRTPSAR